MKRKVLILQAILGIGIICIGVLALQTRKADTAGQRVASLIEIKGTVEVQRAGSLSWIEAAENFPIYEEDTVKTLGSSKVTIRFDEGTVTKLGSLAMMKFASMQRAGEVSQTELAVDNGKAWMRVNKMASPDSTFAVATPSAVAGVRGTYFSAEVDRSETSTFDVFEGAVEVKAKADPSAAVMVNRNERAVVPKGESVEQGTIPEDQIENLGNEITSRDFEHYQYDIVASVEPQQLKPNEVATLSLQLMRGGAINEQVVAYTVTLTGGAIFVSNGAPSIEAESDATGAAQLRITSESENDVKVQVSVSFELAQ